MVSFLLIIIAVYSAAKAREQFFVSRGTDFWLFFLILVCPFISELIVQVGRLVVYGQPIVVSSLDGPARFLLGAVVFVFLSQSQHKENMCKALSLGCLVGLLITFISVFFWREHYHPVGNDVYRAATYIVDPITLAAYSVGLFSLSWMTIENIEKLWIKLLVFSASFGSLVFILFESLARSAWLAFIGLFILWVCRWLSGKKYRLLVAICFLALCVIIFLWEYYLQVIFDRAYLLWIEAKSFMSGDYKDTSTGLRLSLLQIDWVLFKNNLIFGAQDGVLPSYESLLIDIPDLTRKAYDQKLLTGSHFEIAGQISRKGIFGVLTSLCLFIFPLYLFRSRRNHLTRNKLFRFELGFDFVFVMFLAGIGIQIFNLKMTSTFYALVLAVLFASRLENVVRANIDHRKNDRVVVSVEKKSL